MIDGWRYYNHAVIPTCAPHEEPNMVPIKDGSIWKAFEGKPLLARWTSNWDSKEETNWWYIIKDTPLDISLLKAKRRYEINKGIKNFSTQRINPVDYADELFRITVAAWEEWPIKYRPKIEKESFEKLTEYWQNFDIIAGFCRESGKMCSYAVLEDRGSYLEFSSLRSDPSYEGRGINAAMVFGILDYYAGRLKDGYYICDGARSVRHETFFQDYLEKYFGFRKAYCKLHIVYRQPVKIIIGILFPFRKLINGKTKIGSLLASLLKMESFARTV